jgi:site-specific DNA-methyltransferase (adenine-specific)
MKGSIKDNVLKHGVGALNIDATRIPYEDSADLKFAQNAKDRYNGWGMADDGGPVFQGTDKPKAGKRTDSFHNATGGGETQSGGDGSPQFVANETGRFPSNVIGEIPDYQKYFYCPKVSRKERHTGFDTTNIPTNPNEQALSGATEKGNNHPTVKPIELMKYLIKLVTPPGGVVLDPFNGSGSTGCAAVALGYEYIGCELDPAYVEISKRRIEEYNKSENNFDALFE